MYDKVDVFLLDRVVTLGVPNRSTGLDYARTEDV
jgi:hypothetical protein